MKGLFVDIVSFLKSLTLVDYVLYFAVLILIILIVSLIYLLKTTTIDEEDTYDEEDFDIKNTVEQISNRETTNISLTQYEQEQEENAIISYDELVNSIKNKKINYEDDELIDNEVSVRKINLDTMIQEQEENKMNVRAISFEHEEAFLKALKQLQKELN